MMPPSHARHACMPFPQPLKGMFEVLPCSPREFACFSFSCLLMPCFFLQAKKGYIQGMGKACCSEEMYGGVVRCGRGVVSRGSFLLVLRSERGEEATKRESRAFRQQRKVSGGARGAFSFRLHFPSFLQVPLSAVFRARRARASLPAFRCSFRAAPCMVCTVQQKFPEGKAYGFALLRRGGVCT